MTEQESSPVPVEEILAIFPELAEINDEALRLKVATIYWLD